MPELSASALLYVEWISVIFSVGFTILVAYEIRTAWLCGIVGSLLGVVLYSAIGMWGLAGLQVFFTFMGFYGYFTWGSNDDGSIKKKGLRTHLWLIIGGVVLLIGLALPLQELLGSELPYLESFVTIFSVLATFLMAWKWLGHWLYWIVIDSVWLYVNVYLGLSGYAVLSGVYLVLSIYGYWKWKRELSQVRS